jgi:hypothetical protein
MSVALSTAQWEMVAGIVVIMVGIGGLREAVLLFSWKY